MSTLNQRIKTAAQLGKALRALPTEIWASVQQQSYIKNKWFTPDNTQLAMNQIATIWLNDSALKAWAARYPIPDSTDPHKRIGMVMNGHTPLDGFHDLLAVYVAGHRAVVKMAEADEVLLPFVVSLLEKIDSKAATTIQLADKLTGVDAIIATERTHNRPYFKTYFGRYPHLIRPAAKAVGILTGQEKRQELVDLGKDVFSYFGFGQLNVGKLLVPEGYDFSDLLEALHEYRSLVLHDKYKNNYDYNYTLLLLNKTPHHKNGCILLTEDEAVHSRTAQLHYEYYHDIPDLLQKLESKRPAISCVTGNMELDNWNIHPFGAAPHPHLGDYPNDMDTMDFLLQL